MSLRAAQVRFYVDADILGLGKILGSLRNASPIPATLEPSSTSGEGSRAPSQALMCSTRTGYPRWPPGDG
jgi:hypothetical protein